MQNEPTFTVVLTQTPSGPLGSPGFRVHRDDQLIGFVQRGEAGDLHHWWAYLPPTDAGAWRPLHDEPLSSTQEAVDALVAHVATRPQVSTEAPEPSRTAP